MSFKPGDKVVFHKDGSIFKARTHDGLLGKTFTLDSRTGNLSFWKVKENARDFAEDWLILESVYNSKLYKLLNGIDTEQKPE